MTLGVAIPVALPIGLPVALVTGGLNSPQRWGYSRFAAPKDSPEGLPV